MTLAALHIMKALKVYTCHYLNVCVLQTAYFNYRQHYGEAEEKTVHE